MKMKKILTVFLLAVSGVMLLASCSKKDYYQDDWNNYNTKESGIVTYNSSSSPYFVMKMDADGKYGVMYSVDSDQKSWPVADDVVYGDFTVGGSRKVYNKTYGKSTAIEVDDFFDYESDAINSIKRKEATSTSQGIHFKERMSRGELLIK